MIDKNDTHVAKKMKKYTLAAPKKPWKQKQRGRTEEIFSQRKDTKLENSNEAQASQSKWVKIKYLLNTQEK